jgi:hypothetical protein
VQIQPVPVVVPLAGVPGADLDAHVDHHAGESDSASGPSHSDSGSASPDSTSSYGTSYSAHGGSVSPSPSASAHQPMPPPSPPPAASTHVMRTRLWVGVSQMKQHTDATVTCSAVRSADLEPASVAASMDDPWWRAAMDAELDALHCNETWSLVPAPAD